MIRQRMIVGMVAAVAIVGLSACGSDSKSLINPSKDTTATRDTGATQDTGVTTTTKKVTTTTSADKPSSGGVTIPDVTIPNITIPNISIPDITFPDISIPDISIPDFTIPDDSTPALTGNCIALGKDMQSVFGSAVSDPTNISPDQIQQVFDHLKSEVPSDLKDDVDTLRNAVLPFYTALAASNGDMTKALQDPNVQKAMQAMSSADVQAASQALDDWTSKGCPSG
jgi:hypothetical protein